MNIAFVYMNNVRNIGKGAGYVYASIPKEHKTVFYDTVFINNKDLAGSILRGGFDILMISMSTLFLSKTIDLIKKIKTESRIPVLVGGIHSIIVGAKMLKEYSYIDYLCIGEGESFIKDFLQKYGDRNFSQIKNLAYCDGNNIIENSLRPPEDLTMLPEFPYEIFRSVVVDKERFLYVKANRGCPYKCSYCNNKIYLEKYGKDYLRQRPINKVIDELKKLKKYYQPDLFYFADEMFFINEEYTIELIKEIKKQIDIPYGFMARSEYINQDNIKLLKKTGCKYIGMGIECGDEGFRKSVLNRFMTNKQIKTAFRLCKKADITTCSYNMIGYPVDYDSALCKKTVELNNEIQSDICQVTWFYPFPGTEMYDSCKKNNSIDENIYLESYHQGSVLKMHKGKTLSAKKYLEENMDLK